MIKINGTFDLVCYAKGDSMKIESTSGFLYPTEDKWIGKGGKVTWERAGFERSAVYADLEEYTLDVSKSEYSISGIVFHNSEYLSEPHKGILTDKVQPDVDAEKASYPRFDSDLKDIRIPELFKNVDYMGGFSQHGSKFIGSGNAERNATLIFKRYDEKEKVVKDFLFAGAKTYIIRKDQITSPKAEIRMYWEEDSIYHPGLELKFNVEDNELALIRSQQGLSQTPYFDSYHKVDMYVEGIYWKLDEPKINMKMITGVLKVKHFSDQIISLMNLGMRVCK